MNIEDLETVQKYTYDGTVTAYQIADSVQRRAEINNMLMSKADKVEVYSILEKNNIKEAVKEAVREYLYDVFEEIKNHTDKEINEITLEDLEKIWDGEWL